MLPKSLLVQKRITFLQVKRIRILIRPTLTRADWYNIDEIDRELVKQRTYLREVDPLEEYCAANPDKDECRVYDV
jgi:hypothetical protein